MAFQAGRNGFPIKLARPAGKQGTHHRARAFKRRDGVQGRSNRVVSLAQIASSRMPAWWLTEYFGPLEQFAQHLYNEGCVDISVCGIPLQFLRDGTPYYPLSELLDMVNVFRIARLRNRSCPSVAAPIDITAKLNSGQPLIAGEVLELSDALRQLRAFAASQSRKGMMDLILTAKIKLELEKG